MVLLLNKGEKSLTHDESEEEKITTPTQLELVVREP